MHVIIYKSCSKETAKRFADQVESVIPREERNVFTDFEAYEQALKYPFRHRIITILLAENTEKLEKRISTELFEGITNTIMVIPRNNANAHALSRNLHPRFVAHTDEPFDKVALVLMNMIIRQVRNEETRKDHEVLGQQS